MRTDEVLFVECLRWEGTEVQMGVMVNSDFRFLIRR